LSREKKEDNSVTQDGGEGGVEQGLNQSLAMEIKKGRETSELWSGCKRKKGKISFHVKRGLTISATILLGWEGEVKRAD